MSKLNIKIGCDPEFFTKSQYNNAFVFPWGVQGSKSAPFIVKDGAIQRDGLAAELNIEPASTEKEFVDRCKSVFAELKKNIRYDLQLVIEPTAEFSELVMDGLNDSSIELGCVPDFNAYTEEENPRPNAGKPDRQQRVRTGAGHIHVGWDEGIDPRDPNHIADCFDVIKQLDYYIGLPSLHWDKDKKRRSLYGKAGACRIKPYGVEYRTPSNMWFADEELMGFVFRNSVKAVEDLHEGKSAFSQYGSIAQQLINAGDTPNKEWFTLFYPDLPKKYLSK